jgi:hypothetical protein|nr:MAG TPA: hypothetical protein [Caudoviricetes sp.]
MQSFVVKKSLTETLRRMKVGDTMRIKSRDFKLSAVKTAKNRLKKEGIDIKLSEAGMIDECEVTRLC